MFDARRPCAVDPTYPRRTLERMIGPPGFARVVLPPLVAGGLLGSALGACGSTATTLDTGQVESAIEATIRSERGLRTTVQCPAGVPRRTGYAFTCSARLDVGSYPVAVAEKDAAGHIRYGNQAPLIALDVPRVERAIAASILKQRKLRATVSCPATVLQQAGLRFTCAATVAGRTHPFEVTELDSAGHVRYLGR